jgi:hypothetical protein
MDALSLAVGFVAGSLITIGLFMAGFLQVTR